jgi:hypothetical protein
MLLIRYHLSFKPVFSEDYVLQRLSELRQFCLDQAGFDSVGELRTQSLTTLRLSDDILENPQQYYPQHSPRAKIGFVASLGDSKFEGCVYSYPEYGGINMPWYYDGTSWLLPSDSDDLFSRRHLAIIETLDRAEELLSMIKVNDETHYWRHRNRCKLLSMKRVMATCPDPRDLRI